MIKSRRAETKDLKEDQKTPKQFELFDDVDEEVLRRTTRNVPNIDIHHVDFEYDSD